ncbi:hypothetical protein Vadar_025049 [Vaccinium darrowii]|uniref:Uncharacterized protein n=1 Tax=Vaccinium darrowii TaxID=229202 RepID=A0ACB7YPV6_9ERIC|nr:hypothetical protein Vadar_025049 [Vaccinium darrowii]
MQGFKRCYKDSRRLSAELQDPMRSPEHPWGRKSIQKQEEFEAKESDWLGVRALSYNKTSVDCASALFYSMMKLAIETPHSSTSELYANATRVIGTWKRLLKSYLPSVDEEIEVILKFEEMCLESAKEFSSIFAKVLHLLYEADILQEEAILNWASEKEGADESDKVFLKQSEIFIKWLNEASEEED